MPTPALKWLIIGGILALALYLAISAGKNILAGGKEAVRANEIPAELAH